MSWTIIGEHLFIVCAASLLSIVAGLVLGILAYLLPSVRKLILGTVDILQTIPALALLGLIMVVAGAGKLTVVLGITL
jgi:osmoprotectant transport system permease protein